MNSLVLRNYTIKNNVNGFTMSETLVVIAIVGILTSISVPSFLNWRRTQIMGEAINEISGDLRSVSDDARRWGASCTIYLNNYVDKGKPVTFNCIADGSQKSVEVCGRQNGCNIALSGKKVKEYRTNIAGKNLVAILSNVVSATITPRGQLASSTDVLYVLRGTGELGGNPDRRCIVLKRITGELKEGIYNGYVNIPRKGTVPVSRSLNPGLCK